MPLLVTIRRSCQKGAAAAPALVPDITDALDAEVGSMESNRCRAPCELVQRHPVDHSVRCVSAQVVSVVVALTLGAEPSRPDRLVPNALQAARRPVGPCCPAVRARSPASYGRQPLMVDARRITT